MFIYKVLVIELKDTEEWRRVGFLIVGNMSERFLSVG